MARSLAVPKTLAMTELITGKILGRCRWQRGVLARGRSRVVLLFQAIGGAGSLQARRKPVKDCTAALWRAGGGMLQRA